MGLGIIAAVYSDLSDNVTDKYRNGKELPVEVVDYTAAENNVNFAVKGDDFARFYNIESAEDLTFQAKIGKPGENGKASFHLVVDDNFPKLWQKMAAGAGKENDLDGTVIFREGKPAGLVIEKIGFVKLKDVTNEALDKAGIAVEIVIGLIGIMALWLGVMKIAEEAGIIKLIARAARPLTRVLFPEIPADHPAVGSIIMNLSATFLGLGNAATPFGIKAMEDLNTLNEQKDTATNAMCTFMVLNTASFALMPTTAIALRAAAGSSQPAIIIGTTMFGSFCATIVGILATKTFERFPIKLTEIKDWINTNLKFMAAIAAATLLFFVFYHTGVFSLFDGLLKSGFSGALKGVIEIISVLAIPALIFSFVLLGAIKKVKIYETFVEGAKEGFEIAVTIIPYLVAILVAIGIFRAGGAMDWLVAILEPVTGLIGFPAEAIPMALMRPLSGSGSLGIMAEIISEHGPDSFLGILVSTFFGSTETTFYVLAVYFGAVNIRKTRHAVAAGIISDVAGILAALFIVRLLYG